MAAPGSRAGMRPVTMHGRAGGPVALALKRLRLTAPTKSHGRRTPGWFSRRQRFARPLHVPTVAVRGDLPVYAFCDGLGTRPPRGPCQWEAGQAKDRFANRLAPIRSNLRPATVPIALSGEMRANFFLGANPVFRKPHLRGGRASDMVSRSNAGALMPD